MPKGITERRTDRLTSLYSYSLTPVPEHSLWRHKERDDVVIFLLILSITRHLTMVPTIQYVRITSEAFSQTKGVTSRHSETGMFERLCCQKGPTNFSTFGHPDIHGLFITLSNAMTVTPVMVDTC